MKAAWLGTSERAHAVFEGARTVCKRPLTNATYATAGDDVGPWRSPYWCKDCMFLVEQNEKNQ